MAVLVMYDGSDLKNKNSNILNKTVKELAMFMNEERICFNTQH